MNAGALPAAQLACLLYDAADGAVRRRGGCHADRPARPLPARPAFRRIIAAGSSITTGQPLAVIRWTAAIHALEAGVLPCSGSERAILRLAASLADPGIAVSLRENLGNLDARNITLVTDAITAANSC
jgi:hypothetical protein